MSRRLYALLIAASMTPFSAASAAPILIAPEASSSVVDMQYGGEKFSQRHYRWCANRYRSYDPDTNSYWNSYGQRRQCRSPYM